MRSAVLLCCGLLAIGADAAGQIAAGQITGVVRDAGGAVLPGAAVTATDEATGRTRSVVSTADGGYTLPALAPGEYHVDVGAPGFRGEQRAGVHVRTGETARLDFTLSVGDVHERVTVHSDAP